MHDGLDTYLSNCLKNWTAQQQPRHDVRAQLLQKASAYPYTQEETVNTTSFWRKYLLGWRLPQQLPYGELVLGPYTQTRAWTFNLISASRLAT